MIDHSKPEPEKEAELRRILDGAFHRYWEEWRAKHYVLSEEEIKTEMRRSFPVHEPRGYGAVKGQGIGS